MANPTPTPDSNQDWEPKESLASGIAQIAVVAGILAGGLYMYYQRQQTLKTVYEDGKMARELVVKGNPKDLAEARTKFTEALALNSTDPFSVSSMSLIETLLTYDFGQADQKASADEWAGKAEASGGNIDEHFASYALWLVGQGKADEANTYLTAKNDAHLGLGAGMYNALGRVRRAQGKLDEARVLFKKAHDQGWRTARYADDLGDSYFEDGDYINAQGFYDKGLEVNSEHLRSKIAQARAYIARGINLPAAEKNLTEVAGKGDELSPTLKAMVAVAQAELKRAQEKPDEALPLTAAAIAASPTYAWAYAVKGTLVAQKGGPATEVTAAFDKAIALDKSVGVFYFDAAKSLAKLKDGPGAEKYLKAYAAGLKVDDRFHLVYGDLMRDLGDMDKAIVEYGEALKMNGLSAPAHYSMGMALLAKNDPTKAAAEFTAALGAQKRFPDAHVELGNIKFAEKKYNDACEEYANALINLKELNVSPTKIQALQAEVNDKLVKAGQKELSKAWMEQSAALVR
jgi:tetratricopeptide (TPR) repeat protein